MSIFDWKEISSRSIEFDKFRLNVSFVHFQEVNYNQLLGIMKRVIF